MSASPEPCIEKRPEGVLLRVRTQPRASRNAARLADDGRLHVAVTAPAVEDAANTALLTFLADLLGVRKQCILLQAGMRSRDKSFLVKGMDMQQIAQRLRNLSEHHAHR